jgi:hypothetical protein
MAKTNFQGRIIKWQKNKSNNNLKFAEIIKLGSHVVK